MVTNIIFSAFVCIASVLAQGSTPFDKEPPSSDIMANIFAWANDIRPMDPVISQSASVVDAGLPPEPDLPDINAGFPPGPELGLPKEPKLPRKDHLSSNPTVQDPVVSQSTTVVNGGSPREPVLPNMLPVKDMKSKPPSESSAGALELPGNVIIKDNVQFEPGTNQGLPSNQGSLFNDRPGSNPSFPTNVNPQFPTNVNPGIPADVIPNIPTDVNLDADIVDPNLLFPAETANAPNPGVGDNKLMLNFLPMFPKNEKVVNLNSGQTLNSASEIGILSDPNIADSSVAKFPAEKPTTSMDLSTFFPKGEKVVNLNSGQTFNSLSGFPSGKTPMKPDLSVVSPFVPNGNQPLVGPQSNNNILNVPVETLPQKPLAERPVAEPLPFAPPTGSIDPPVRPIGMLPVGTIEAANKPVQLPADRPNLAFVQPEIFGLPDSLVPTNAQVLSDIPGRSQGQNVVASVGSVRTAGDRGIATDTNKMPSNWLNLYPNGKPNKLKKVKSGAAQDIAPPTVDVAMMSAISLTNFGKDRAMRRMLREQRKKARKNKRLQRQRQQGGRGRIQNEGNGPNQGNVPNQQNQAQGRNQNRNVNRGPMMGRRGAGRKKLRRSKRKAPWKDGKVQEGKDRNKMKKQKGFVKQRGKGRQFQRKMQRIFPHMDNAAIVRKGDGNLLGGLAPDVSQLDGLNLPDGQLSELPVTAQIIQEGTKYIPNHGLPKFKPTKWEKKQKRKLQLNMGPKQRNIRKKAIMVSDSSVADLAITEQIKHEAAKDVGNLAFPRKELKQQKKQKRIREFPKDPLQVSQGSVDNLAVTEQIKHEAAKHVGNLAFTRKELKQQKKQKRIREFPKDPLPVSQGSVDNLAVTEQIKHEAAKHVGNLAFPRKELKRQKKQKRVRKFQRDPLQVSQGSVDNLAVTEQIKHEAAKHVGNLAFTRKELKQQKKQKRIREFSKDPLQVSQGSVDNLAVTEQIKHEAAKHVDNLAFTRKELKQQKKQKRIREFPKDPLQVSQGSVDNLAVTEQIKQEAAKHVGNLAFPKKELKRQKKQKRIRKFQRDPLQVSQGSVDNLAVTEQIKHEAAKHVGNLAFTRKELKRQNKQKWIRKLPKDAIQVSQGSVDNLAVTEQIKQEAAKHVGNLAFPRKELKRQKKQKLDRKVPKDAIQVSDSGTVTEQIKQEASKHVGALAFPNNELRKQKQLKRQKSKKLKNKNKFPMDKVEVTGGFNGLPVNEQITREAAKHVGGQALPRKWKGKQNLRDHFNPDDLPNSGNQFISDGGAIGIDKAPIDLPKLKGGRQIKQRLQKPGKRKSFVQRMRSGKIPKTRIARKFVDVTMLDTGPTSSGGHALTDESNLGQKPTIPGLGTIDFSSHLDGITQFRR